MTIKNVIKGDGMKRTNLLLVAVAIIVLSVASVAYASTTSGYVAWTSQGANAGTQPTPHKDFTLTTQKCAVCHAVHKANASGELLLRGNVQDACSYCHIDNLIGNIRIYNGNSLNYSSGNAVAHNGDTTQARCVECHAVHGANTMSGNVSAKILKSGGWETSMAALAAYDPATAGRDGQVSLFCTKCHPYWQNASSGDINTDDSGGMWSLVNANPDGLYQSHVMTTALSMTNGVGTAGTYTGQVAWIESAHCRDCHDAGLVDMSNSYVGTITAQNFPHYTYNAARFLLGATYNGAVDTAGVGSQEDSAQVDGACLKCHRTATNGVGYNY